MNFHTLTVTTRPMPVSLAKEFQLTHPWLTFTLDLRKANTDLWLRLGEAQSKCEHIAGVPLLPEVADELHRVYLTKGVQGTAAIEGNTLSVNEVAMRLKGQLPLPPSREYLGREVDNIMAAINQIFPEEYSSGNRISVDDLRSYNRRVLDGLPLEPHVVPGEVRSCEVGVGGYLGAPAQNCEYLLAKLCEWLNEAAFRCPPSESVAWGVLRAVMAHLYIAWIHPFGDGNGRTARLAEFKILVGSGVPGPAAHLLSNHYNMTRDEYYRQLRYASESKGDVLPFISYAVQGFVDGLKEQLSAIKQQQWTIAWRDYLHKVLPDGTSKTSVRKRHLVLDLTDSQDPVPFSKVKKLSVRISDDYRDVSDKTLLRDLSELIDQQIIRRDSRGYAANREAILQFLPMRLPTPQEEARMLQEELDLELSSLSFDEMAGA